MRAFVVRPFGTKEVMLGGSRDSIDFDHVEEVLIVPALLAAEIDGGTTQEILEQGNIREDMFRLLVTSEIVVADVSIHNANVFYELGIRHGLRDRTTFLLRANVDSYPFDLATDRYLVYDPKNPAGALKELTRALRATRGSNRVDSPVYQLLPSLRPPDPSDLHVVPRDFVEATERARASRWRGDLRLLAHEARDFHWAVEGLRTVGRAQYAVRSYGGARETFEWLLEQRQDDVEANQKLAMVYQQLSRAAEPQLQAEYLTRSTQAIQRVIDAQETDRHARAEAYALQGRNLRARWLQSFAGRAPADARVFALRSPSLEEAQRAFASGFQHDLNHFYSGVSAMALLRIRIDLGQALPEVWLDQFDTEDDARVELARCESLFQQLSGAVALSLAASRNALDKQSNPDLDEQISTEISEADHALLTGRRPRTVAQRYREALTDAPSFAVSAVREQLAMFEQLQVRSEFVKEVSVAVDEVSQGMAPDTLAVAGRISRVIMFTGHRVDAEGRATPRFPRTPGAEKEARRLIAEAVAKECEDEPGPILGVAGGGCGGDILFHEVCAELGITTKMYLAIPKEPFSAKSVQIGGADWVDRYEQLVERLKPRVLSESEDLPNWLEGRDYTVWQRDNLWMLFQALAMNARGLTLIALWNGAPADGPGGTQDLVDQVRARGYKVVRLEAERLKDL